MTALPCNRAACLAQSMPHQCISTSTASGCWMCCVFCQSPQVLHPGRQGLSLSYAPMGRRFAHIPPTFTSCWQNGRRGWESSPPTLQHPKQPRPAPPPALSWKLSARLARRSPLPTPPPATPTMIQLLLTVKVLVVRVVLRPASAGSPPRARHSPGEGVFFGPPGVVVSGASPAAQHAAQHAQQPASAAAAGTFRQHTPA